MFFKLFLIILLTGKARGLERITDVISDAMEYNITVYKEMCFDRTFDVNKEFLEDFLAKSRSTIYHWCVTASLKKIQNNGTYVRPVEVILSNGFHINAEELNWVDEDELAACLRDKKTVHFCYDKDSVTNNRLRIILTTMSEQQVGVTLKVDICQPDRKWDMYEKSDGQKVFQDRGRLTVGNDLYKEFLPSHMSEFDPSEMLMVHIKAEMAVSGGEVGNCVEACIHYPECEGHNHRIDRLQIMSTRATFVLNPQKFPNGFLVTLITKPSTPSCDIKNNEEIKVTILVRSNASVNSYYLGVFVTLAVLVVLVLIALLASALNFVYNRPEEVLEQTEGETDIPLNFLVGPEDLFELGITVEHSDRLKPQLSLADLSTKTNDPNYKVEVYTQSKEHLGVVLLISAFYSVTALQLVFWSSSKNWDDGDQDVCYFNFLCLKPFGYLTAFNNVFSNIGYVFAGLLFVGLVQLREKKHRLTIRQLPNYKEHEYGVQRQPFIFYALGVSLAMVGVMAGCYRKCPNIINYQFDTTYMYLIVILMILQLYRNRHPDVSIGGFKLGILLAVLLIIEAISLYVHNITFWVIFCIFYILLLLLTGLNTYTLSALKLHPLILCSAAKMIIMEIRRAFGKDSRRIKRSDMVLARVRLVTILIGVLANIGHIIYLVTLLSTGNKKKYASIEILLMIMTNHIIYTTYYLTMKLLSGETLSTCCRIYIVLYLLLVVPAIYFFTRQTVDTDLEPAQSRQLNQDCILFNFFDSHDISNLLSAVAFFFVFMFLLNIDEDIKFKKKTLIPVF